MNKKTEDVKKEISYEEKLNAFKNMSDEEIKIKDTRIDAVLSQIGKVHAEALNRVMKEYDFAFKPELEHMEREDNYDDFFYKPYNPEDPENDFEVIQKTTYLINNRLANDKFNDDLEKNGKIKKRMKIGSYNVKMDITKDDNWSGYSHLNIHIEKAKPKSKQPRKQSNNKQSNNKPNTINKGKTKHF